MRERLIRAGAAVAAGLWIAVEHLRDRPATQPEAEVRVAPARVAFPCPMCPGSLNEGPHFHGADVFWPTEHDGAIIITDRAGGDTYIVGGAE